MKKTVLFAIASCVMTATAFAAHHHGPSRGFGHYPHHHHVSFWGHGGHNFWGGFGGALLGNAIAGAFTPSPVIVQQPVIQPAPVVVPQPTVIVPQPVVVQQPVIQPAPVVVNNTVQNVVPRTQVSEERVWVPATPSVPGHFEIIRTVREYVR